MSTMWKARFAGLALALPIAVVAAFSWPFGHISPEPSVLLGPLYAIRADNPHENIPGIGCAIVLGSGMLGFLIRPHLVTGLIAVFSLAAWVFVGILSHAANC